MTKEKLVSLTKYKNELTEKLRSGEVPIKHVDHPNSYINFLKNELKIVTAKLEEAALEGKAGK